MSRFIRLMGAAAFIAAAPFLEKAFGGGAPTFGSPQIITNAISAGSGNYMVMGDFDGDGIPDVAILGTADNTTAGSSAGVVEVHFGDGKNGFRSAAAIFANGTSGTEFGGNISPGMAAADLNGGGKSELIFPAGNAVLIYEWNGTSFSQTRSISLLGTGMSQAYAVAVGNLTTTNSRDIIVSDEFGAAGVVWIPNDGKGNFGTPVGFPIASIYAAPLTGTYRPLVLANVNGKNGLDDVILSWGNPISSTPGSAAGSTVGVLLNNGDGTLSREVSYGNPTLFAVPGLTINTFGLTVADVDGDGKLDLVSMCFTYDSLGAGKSYLSVNLGNGDGTFKDGKAFYIGAQGFSAMDAADLNGDGRVDIVTADNPVSEDGKFTVTEWTGTGDSLAVARQESYYGGDQYFNSLALGYKKANGQFVTFNNDIKVDVLLGTCLDLHDSYSEFAVFQNQTEKNVPAAMASFSATGPSGPGAAITFDATTLAGWSVYVQSNTNAANAGSWTDLPAPNGGQMVESTTHRTNYSLVSAAYPNGSGIAFRAVASKTGYTDIISGALGGFKLAQAVLSISVKLTSTSDPVHGSVTYLGDNLVYTFIVINSGSAAANNLQVSAPVPTYLPADNSGLHQQFTTNDLTISSGGRFVSATGTTAAKVVWDAGNLHANAQLSETFTIRVSGKVRTSQRLGIPNNYFVSSASGQPPVGVTGISSGAANVGSEVAEPVSFTLVHNSTLVAPGGLLTYTFALSNLSSSVAAHPVAVVDVPPLTRFANSYPNGASKSVSGVSFVSAVIPGTTTEDIFYGGSGNQSQVVIDFGALAAHPDKKGLDAATFNVVFQAQWLDPAAMPAVISTGDYLAAFVNPASVALFTKAYAAGYTDFVALLSDTSHDIGLSKNASGVVNVPLQGSLANAPGLHVLKILSSSLTNSQDDGNGHTVDLVQPGSLLTFVLVAVNNGGSEAEDVFIEDVMPNSSSYVSNSLLYATPKTKSTPSTLNSASTFTVVQDPDGHHLRFEGLRLAAGDSVGLEYTVRVFDGTKTGQPAPAVGTFLDPAVAIDPTTGLPEPSSIGSSSTPDTWAGFYIAKPLEVIGLSQFAQPIIRTLFPHPAVSANVSATSNALTAFYKKTPNAVPLTNANNPASFYPGVERYYIHYENTGKLATGAKLDVPLPAHTAFLRAAFVTLTPNVMPGMLPYLPGIITNPPGAGILLPSSPGGTVTFKLPTLSVAQQGDVMVEVVITPDAVQAKGSLLGDPTAPVVVIYDSTVKNPSRAMLRQMEGGVVLLPPQRTAPFNAVELTADYLIAGVPSLGIMKTVPQQVRQGDTFQEVVVVYNYGEFDTGVALQLIVPDNTELVSADAGQSTVLPSEDPSAGDIVVAYLASNNGPSANIINPLRAHTAAALTVTLRAIGAVGSTIMSSGVDDSNARISQEGAGEIQPPPTSTSIIDPGTTASTATWTVHTSLPLFQPIINSTDVAIIGMGGGNILVQGPANLVSIAGGSLISQDGAGIVAQGAGNIVASGAGNLIAIGATTGASLLGNQSSIVAQGAGNILVPEGASIVAQGAGNIVAAGAGNLFGQAGSGIVAQGAGNIVAQGAGNIVAQGAGNIVAQGAGNIVAAGAGNIVAQGAGNIVAQGAGNVAKQESAEKESAQTTGFILASTPGSTAVIRTTAGNLFGIGGGSFRPSQ